MLTLMPAVEKISNNRTRQRLAYGEVNERRERSAKRHKPQRLAKDWEVDAYEPRRNKRVAIRRRVLSTGAAIAYLEE